MGFMLWIWFLLHEYQKREVNRLPQNGLFDIYEDLALLSQSSFRGNSIIFMFGLTVCYIDLKPFFFRIQLYFHGNVAIGFSITLIVTFRIWNKGFLSEDLE